MRIILNIALALLPLLPSVSGAAEERPGRSADAAVQAPFREPAEEPAPTPEHGKAFTGDATPVEPGRVEVELAYAPTWWATAGAIDRLSGEQHTIAAAVTVGIVRDLDARVVLGWSLAHAAPGTPGAPVHGEGLADTTVAARWRFLSLPDPRVEFAVSLGLTMPTGMQESADRLATGRGAWSVGGALLASADWGRFTAGLELGFSALVAPSAWNDVGLLVANAALGFQLLPWLQPEVELNYQHEIELGAQPDERVLWATAAAVLPLDPVRVVVGARFPVWTRDTAVGPTGTAAVKMAF